MPTKARVVILPKEKKPMYIIETNLPDPGPFEVVVKQFASGICHSQVHEIHGDRSSPLLLGHEGSGVVIAKGKEVKHVKEGDYVLLTWIPRNKSSNPRLPIKPSLKLPDGNVATTLMIYTWADNTVADEQYVVKVPQNTPMDVASIVGCAVITGAGAVTNTVGVKKGESVAIFGMGGVGLSAVAAASAVGAYPIIAIDIDETKLKFALKFGATTTINASKEDPVKAIRNLTPHFDQYDTIRNPICGVDYAFDCIGRKQTMEQILSVVRQCNLGATRGGSAVLVGVPQGKPDFDLFADFILYEKKFIGSFGGSCVPERDFPTLLNWNRTGQLDLNVLVTSRYKLDQINEAVADLEQGKVKGRAILTF